MEELERDNGKHNWMLEAAPGVLFKHLEFGLGPHSLIVVY